MREGPSLTPRLYPARFSACTGPAAGEPRKLPNVNVLDWMTTNALVGQLVVVSTGIYTAIPSQFIALGTGDGTIKLLDHAGTFLKDRTYSLVSALACTLLY